ncbi:MAG: VOC family protein [Mesorhizobium sp.]
MADIEGNFVWYELLTPAIGAAADFYANVVGFTAGDMVVDNVAYKILSAGERPTAAIVETVAFSDGSGALSGWVGYLAVKDVDEVVAMMHQLAAVVRLKPCDAAGIGRFAIVSDPQGAAIGLFAPSPDSASRTEGDSTLNGHVAWHELYTGDPQEALSFYRRAFGWRPVQTIDMGAAGPYLIFSTGGEPAGGIARRPQEISQSLWSPFFRVNDIEAAAHRVVAEGGKVFDQPREVPDGDFTLRCFDRQGAVFALVGPKAS